MTEPNLTLVDPTTLPPDGPQPNGPWYERPFFKTCQELRPWLTILFMIASGFFMYWLSQRDTNAANAVTVTDLQRDVQSIHKEINDRASARDRQVEKLVTGERFEERTNNITQRLDRIESQLNQVIIRLSQR